jgi:hypothetical protein
VFHRPRRQRTSTGLRLLRGRAPMFRISTEGRTRLALVLGPVALKLARGRRSNRYEHELYNRVSERRRAMLCPYLCCDPLGAPSQREGGSAAQVRGTWPPEPQFAIQRERWCARPVRFLRKRRSACGPRTAFRSGIRSLIPRTTTPLSNGRRPTGAGSMAA